VRGIIIFLKENVMGKNYSSSNQSKGKESIGYQNTITWG
jgi:hypothetical protein